MSASHHLLPTLTVPLHLSSDANCCFACGLLSMKLTGHGLVVDQSTTTMSFRKTSPLVSTLFSYSLTPLLPLRVCLQICVCECLLSVFLLSLHLAACQIYELPVCTNTSSSSSLFLVFWPSYSPHVASCNLRTSNPGSSSLPLNPAQRSRERLLHACLSLMKRSGRTGLLIQDDKLLEQPEEWDWEHLDQWNAPFNQSISVSLCLFVFRSGAFSVSGASVFSWAGSWNLINLL